MIPAPGRERRGSEVQGQPSLCETLSPKRGLGEEEKEKGGRRKRDRNGTYTVN